MNLCIFCGSALGNEPVYREQSRDLAKHMVARGINLVYGGARIGIMGLLADELLQGGCRVYGYIPAFLQTHEVGHSGLTELHVVDTMHTRKRNMFERSDAILALPGGMGTLEELVEVLTWSQLQLHQKPIGLLNIAGYYDPFLRFLDHMTEKGFLKAGHRNLLHVSDHPERILEILSDTPGNLNASSEFELPV